MSDDEGIRRPCVRVPREQGERVRRQLAEAGVLDEEFAIGRGDGVLYLPVTDPLAAGNLGLDPDLDPTVVDHRVERRRAQTTPSDLLEFSPTYERLGDVAIVDEDDPDRARRTADAIVASDIPVETAINRASRIKGDERVRDWELLVGEDTETVHREYGCEYLVDVTEVYFSPRLATDRHRVARQVRDGERAFDMFAGVGPFAIPFAKRGAEIVAVDLNERAIEYLRENLRRNGVEDAVRAVHGDVREVAVDYTDRVDRIVMNLPHTADEFLNVAASVAGDECVIHYYDIQDETNPFGPGERAIRAATDPDYDVAVETRRVVRSYSPHEVNVRLDARLTRRV